MAKAGELFKGNRRKCYKNLKALCGKIAKPEFRQWLKQSSFQRKSTQSLRKSMGPLQQNRKHEISSMAEAVELSKEINENAIKFVGLSVTKSQNPNFAND
jgi:hypothetical protein